ncbi:MAG: phosphate ABC transporter permease PstA [Candidatus Eremiobacteraeota bacterium]|nr:phosphate ABC transporter permease PstA [Candidatus Eremiobacteraeota bacterium]
MESTLNERPLGFEERSTLRSRHFWSAVGVALTALCAATAALALLFILGYVAARGMRALNWDFLTQLPRPVGVPGGGVANGIAGSLIIVAIATLIATPVGVMTGIYLALYGRGWIAEAIRFLADVLSGIPSIAIGLFAYTLLVAPFKHFSAVSASFAFAILMLPLIIRTSEEAIRTVPLVVREGALALGMSMYRATTYIVLPAARPAIITGLLLAVARITGETAPLLFTAFGSQFWELDPRNPMAELSLQIFTYAISPYKTWQEQAWAGALLLIVAVFIVNVLARLLFSRRVAGIW